MNNLNEDKTVDHEVRIRIVEDFLETMGKKIQHIQDKIDNQFNLIVGAILTGCIGVALHMSRLL